MAGPRIIFMGTPQFAVRSLEACLLLGEVVAVLTQPDRPKGRGQEVVASPVKLLAAARGLSVLQPAKLRGTEVAAQLRALTPDVTVVTAYGKILPQDVLDAPRHGSVNVHASLLPRWRGAAPIQRAIEAGDSVTGVSLMKMDAGLDTGPVFAQRSVPIGSGDTSETLHHALSELGFAALTQELPAYLAGSRPPVPQPSSGVTLAPMLTKEEGALDFAQEAGTLERRLRAFVPWPGSYTRWSGSLVKVTRVQLGEGTGAPGTVLAAGPQGIEVACGRGSLRLLELQPEGKRRMSVADFLQGRKIEVGAKPFGF